MKKGQPLQQMRLAQLAVRMQIDPFLSPCTMLNCKWIKDLQTRYTETNRTERRGEFKTHRHRGNFPEQNTNGLCS